MQEKVFVNILSISHLLNIAFPRFLSTRFYYYFNFIIVSCFFFFNNTKFAIFLVFSTCLRNCILQVSVFYVKFSYLFCYNFIKFFVYFLGNIGIGHIKIDIEFLYVYSYIFNSSNLPLFLKVYFHNIVFQERCLHQLPTQY